MNLFSLKPEMVLKRVNSGPCFSPEMPQRYLSCDTKYIREGIIKSAPQQMELIKRITNIKAVVLSCCQFLFDYLR